MESEGTFDHHTVTKWFKKFLLDYNNFDNQSRSGKPKIMDSEAVLQAIEVNLEIGSQKVSGELGISQSSVVCHFHNLGKSIWSC